LLFTLSYAAAIIDDAAFARHTMLVFAPRRLLFRRHDMLPFFFFAMLMPLSPHFRRVYDHPSFFVAACFTRCMPARQ